MITKEISSLQHPFIKNLVRLRKERAARQAEQKVVICGTKLVSEIGAYTPIETLLIESSYPIPKHLNFKEVVRIPIEILKKVSGVQAPESLAAVVALPASASLQDKQHLLALDGISDPGNLGTLIRTALALGWEGVFITTESTDPFNEKALRAAKGATFRLPLAYGSTADLAHLIDRHHFHAYIADLQGESPRLVKKSPPLVLILGSESHGVSGELKKRYPALSIPMSGKMESLNVAAAGAILMYEMNHV